MDRKIDRHLNVIRECLAKFEGMPAEAQSTKLWTDRLQYLAEAIAADLAKAERWSQRVG